MNKFKNIKIGSIVKANKPIVSPDIIYADTSYVAVTDLAKLSPPFQYYDSRDPWKHLIDEEEVLVIVDFNCIPIVQMAMDCSISYFTFLLPKTGKKIHLNIMMFHYSTKEQIQKNMKEIIVLSEEQFLMLFKLVE